jgi:uncharacterized protein
VDGLIRAAPGRTLGLDEGAWLVSRLGPEYASRRARLELAEEAKGARRETKANLSFWPLLNKYIARLLKAAGMLDRGQANATRIQVTRNFVEIPGLPGAFHGYTLLHITDLHADISLRAMRALPEVIRTLQQDYRQDHHRP